MQKNWEVTLRTGTLASPWLHVGLCAHKLILAHAILFRTQKALSFFASPSYILEKTYSSWWSDRILTETNVNSKREKLGLRCWLFLRPGKSCCAFAYQLTYLCPWASSPTSSKEWVHSPCLNCGGVWRSFALTSPAFFLSVGYVSDHRMLIVRAMQKQ